MNPGRPERDESDQYYFRYIDLVPEGDIGRILADQRDETLSFLGSIPESKTTYRYAADKWSVTEVLSHLNDCERLFIMRAFWFARDMKPPLPSFESDYAVTTARSEERPWSAHVEEFASVRASTLTFFDNLPDEAWQRRGTASDMPFTPRALAYIAAGHITHHLGILKDRYLA